MKKLSKTSLDSMAKMLPELDEMDQRSILGGTSTGAYPEGYTGSVAVPITGYTDADPYGVTGEYMTSASQSSGEYSTGAVTTGDYSTGLYTEFYENLMDMLGVTGTYSGVTIYAERFEYTDQSTISKYYITSSDNCVEQITGYFMEPPWDYSQTMIEGSKKAIQPGEYELLPYNTKKYSDNYILDDVPGRSLILIHRGHYPEHTVGCLLPGNSYNENEIINSKDAYNELNEYLKKHGSDGMRIIISNNY